MILFASNLTVWKPTCGNCQYKSLASNFNHCILLESRRWVGALYWGWASKPGWTISEAETVHYPSEILFLNGFLIFDLDLVSVARMLFLVCFFFFFFQWSKTTEDSNLLLSNIWLPRTCVTNISVYLIF